jgi:hypothetical protein
MQNFIHLIIALLRHMPVLLLFYLVLFTRILGTEEFDGNPYTS